MILVAGEALYDLVLQGPSDDLRGHPGGAAFNFDQQIGVIQLAGNTFLTFPDDCRLMRHTCVFPTIQTASDDVESPADEPSRPFHAG